MKFQLVATLGFLCATAAAAGASSFPREPGTSFLEVQYASYQSPTFITNAGQYVPAGCTFEKHELSVYGEVGLSKHDTLTAQIPYDSLRCGANTTAGFTDLEVGLNHNLHRGATTTFGVRADAIVPAGYSIGANPRLGYGRPGLEVDALYGGNFAKKAFFDTQTGVRAYSGYPAAQFHTTGTVGYNADRYLVYGQVDYVTHTTNGTTLTNIGVNPTVQPAYTALQGTIAGTLRIAPGTSLFLSSTSLLSGRNTGQGHSLNAGFWLTF